MAAHAVRRTQRVESSRRCCAHVVARAREPDDRTLRSGWSAAGNMSTPVEKRSLHFERKRLRQIANLYGNLYAMPLPRQWISDTCKLLLKVHKGTYAVENRERISSYNLKCAALKRAKIRRSRAATWRPKKTLARLPAYSRSRAYGVRLVLLAYRNALACHRVTPSLAERVGLALWVFIFGKPIAAKSLHRIIARIESRGGIDRAPIEAYAQDKALGNRRRSSFNRRLRN